jgi:hypothetical protein
LSPIFLPPLSPLLSSPLLPYHHPHLLLAGCLDASRRSKNQKKIFQGYQNLETPGCAALTG